MGEERATGKVCADVPNSEELVPGILDTGSLPCADLCVSTAGAGERHATLKGQLVERGCIAVGPNRAERVPSADGKDTGCGGARQGTWRAVQGVGSGPVRVLKRPRPSSAMESCILGAGDLFCH